MVYHLTHGKPLNSKDSRAREMVDLQTLSLIVKREWLEMRDQ